MLSTVARRAAATPVVRRNMSTQAAKFPFKGIADGGHLNQLQREPAFFGYWMNFKASPEIIPVAGCVAFAMALGAYKMTVVDTAGVAFVDRAGQFEK